MSTYVYRQTSSSELDRLRSLEALFDGGTTRRLELLGVAPGWRVLEVGFGAGSIARWLADRVGPAGHVVATDLDPRFLDGYGVANLETRQHDILVDDLETDSYDLVHARAVVEHLPDRDRALKRMAAALRPGGWLVVEDVDLGPATVAALAPYVHPARYAQLYHRTAHAVYALFTAAGADPHCGARLYGALVELDLRRVDAEIHAPVTAASSTFISRTLRELRPLLLDAGLVTETDLHAVIEAAADPAFRAVPMLMVTAWGQRGEG